MNCLRCQQENPPAQKFCGECGVALEGKAQAVSAKAPATKLTTPEIAVTRGQPDSSTSADGERKTAAERAQEHAEEIASLIREAGVGDMPVGVHIIVINMQVAHDQLAPVELMRQHTERRVTPCRLRAFAIEVERLLVTRK